mmetsp:Transcript_26501/g.64005  ORF Transcript_26501/g.64005 Transcript_26501/m.64005 type:complete len:313 (+) Transcript_26501:1412-2350(+)
MPMHERGRSGTRVCCQWKGYISRKRQLIAALRRKLFCEVSTIWHSLNIPERSARMFWRSSAARSSLMSMMSKEGGISFSITTGCEPASLSPSPCLSGKVRFPTSESSRNLSFGPQTTLWKTRRPICGRCESRFVWEWRPLLSSRSSLRRSPSSPDWAFITLPSVTCCWPKNGAFDTPAPPGAISFRLDDFRSTNQMVWSSSPETLTPNLTDFHRVGSSLTWVQTLSRPLKTSRTNREEEEEELLLLLLLPAPEAGEVPPATPAAAAAGLPEESEPGYVRRAHPGPVSEDRGPRHEPLLERESAVAIREDQEP